MVSPEGHGWPSESVCCCTGGVDPAVLDTGVCVCIYSWYCDAYGDLMSLWGHFVLGGHYQVHTEVCIFLHSHSSVVSAKKPHPAELALADISADYKLK